jgi:hypothetical protein
MRKLILILVISIIFINLSWATLPTHGPFMDPNLPSDKTNDQGAIKSATDNSNSEKTNSFSETPSINVTRKIISPCKDKNIFRSEIFEVIVKVTCLQKDGIDDLEIWEIPDENLIIENCSYPITTSSINKVLEYEALDKSYLNELDIKDYDSIIYIKKLLTNNSSDLYPSPFSGSNNNCSKVYKHIYDILSPETQRLLNEQDSRTDINKLKLSLIKDFNRIIASNSSQDINISLFSKYCSSNIDRRYIESYDLNSNNCLIYRDNKLIKRKLLEQIFPNMIVRRFYNKLHEDMYVNSNINGVQVNARNLYQGESIIFKYYVRPTKLGYSEIRSIIRTKRTILEELTPIRIVERGERFNIDYWSESKELESGKSYRFVYYIEYLGGNDEQNTFSIIFDAPIGCELGENAKYKVHGSWVDYKEENPSINGFDSKRRMLYLTNFGFLKGKIEEIAINVTYTEPKLRLSPPTVTIGNFTKEDFDADLNVYSWINIISRLYYEWLSIILVFIALFITVIELELTRRELHSSKDQIAENRAQIVKNRELNDKLLETICKLISHIDNLKKK